MNRGRKKWLRRSLIAAAAIVAIIVFRWYCLALTPVRIPENLKHPPEDLVRAVQSHIQQVRMIAPESDSMETSPSVHLVLSAADSATTRPADAELEARARAQSLVSDLAGLMQALTALDRRYAADSFFDDNMGIQMLEQPRFAQIVHDLARSKYAKFLIDTDSYDADFYTSRTVVLMSRQYIFRLPLMAAQNSLDRGDTRRAIERFVDTFYLGHFYSRTSAESASAYEYGSNRAVMGLSRMLEQGQIPRDLLASLRDEVTKTALPLGNLLVREVAGYQEYRSNFVGYFSKPLEEIALERNWGFNPEDWGTDKHRIPFPRAVDVLGIRIINVFHPEVREEISFRRDFESHLKDFDRIYGEHLRRLQLPYPDLKALPPIPEPENWTEKGHGAVPSFYPYFDASSDWRLFEHLSRQARFNFLVASLQYLHDPSSYDAAAGVNFREHPDHPWRDPFSEERLRLIEDDEKLVIYSVGPDLEDQKGAVRWEGGPSKLEGDIVLVIPKRNTEH